jgi:hypothetical protein
LLGDFSWMMMMMSPCVSICEFIDSSAHLHHYCRFIEFEQVNELFFNVFSL